MNTPHYEFPKPMWRKNADGTVDIKYANDAIQYGLHLQQSPRQGDTGTPDNGYGWSGDYIKQEFPSAVHGPNGQSLTVHNKEQKKKALAACWSLRPVGTEVDPSLGPVTDFNQAPHGLETVGK